MKPRKFLLCLGLIAIFAGGVYAKRSFISVQRQHFIKNGKPYNFIGTNYWYGGLLALEKDPKRGILRLRKELDFLKANGVTNLRVLGGAEGTGLINNVPRVGPALQPVQGKFNRDILRGLDILLDEMAKREMVAVIFFSNNWEWSGGFQQYLIWNGIEPLEFLTRKPTWDEYRDLVAKFYTCTPCKKAYREQVAEIVNRRNNVNGRAYAEDPTIMSWELANEPRPMRPEASKAYEDWIAESAAYIKSLDENHLLTIGHEGSIGNAEEGMPLFESIHDDKNIDYMTMHIWARNWGWYERPKIEAGFNGVIDKTKEYIEEHIAIAKKQKKPLVIEEFGFPRDGEAFDSVSTTSYRDRYFDLVFSYLGEDEHSNQLVNGVSFWAFGGSARPIDGQEFWQPGDEYMGDPPMEEQGLYTVFDSDKSTWAIIGKHGKHLK